MTASPAASFTGLTGGSAIDCARPPLPAGRGGGESAADTGGWGPPGAESEASVVSSLRLPVWLNAMTSPVTAVMIAATPVRIPGTVCHQLGGACDLSDIESAFYAGTRQH